MRQLFDERGESLIQFVVGTLAGALLLAFIASALTGTFQIGVTQTTRQTSELASDVFSQRVGPEGDSATSVFIPSHDVFGAANSVVNTPTTGGVIGQPAAGAHEVDFMQRGVGILGLVGLFDKFWAYYYDAGTHQLIKYTYTTRSAAGLATGVSAAGATISNVRSFNASYLLASQLRTVEHYMNATGATPPDVQIQTGFPEVYEGNRGVVVWIDSTSLKSATSNPKLLHYIYLQPASAPQAPQVNYTWSPPPSLALAAAPNITFASNGTGGWLAGSPTSTITVQEPYYHRGFTNTTCVSGGTTIATLSAPVNEVLGADNVANNPPSSYPGEWQQYNVTPVAAGTCTVTFASTTAAPDPDDKTASVTITVADPSVSYDTWPASWTLGVGGASVGTSSGAIAYTGSAHDQRVAELLNRLFGGGVARAAGGQPCYALAQTNGTSPAPDTSFMQYSAFAGGFYVAGLEGGGTSMVTVDTSGCEIWADTMQPLSAAQVGAVVYNASSANVQYSLVSNSGCAGIFLAGGWSPTNTNVVQTLLTGTGQAAGSCSLTFSDGQSTQTPNADSGLVNVAVSASACDVTVSGSCWLLYDYFPAIDNSSCQEQRCGAAGSWALVNTAGAMTTKVSLAAVPAADIQSNGIFDAIGIQEAGADDSASGIFPTQALDNCYIDVVTITGQAGNANGATDVGGTAVGGVIGISALPVDPFTGSGPSGESYIITDLTGNIQNIAINDQSTTNVPYSSGSSCANYSGP